MRRNLYSLGMAMYVSALVIPVILMIVEVQYWTHYAFTAAKLGHYTDPGLTLNFTGSTAAWLTVFAVVASLAATVLLLGRRRLIAIGAMWVALGASLNGHLYHGLGHGWWIVLALLAVVSAFSPPFGIYRRLYAADELATEHTLAGAR